MDEFINRVEFSILLELVGLYTSDLETARHEPGHAGCIACCKEEILRAIDCYRRLDSLHRRQIELLAT